MSGASHVHVPGRDCAPLIAVEETAKGWRFIVRDFNGHRIGSLWFQTQEDAQQAENEFRYEVAHAPDGKVAAVILDWFDRKADLPAWWEIGKEARG